MELRSKFVMNSLNWFYTNIIGNRNTLSKVYVLSDVKSVTLRRDNFFGIDFAVMRKS